MKEKSMNAVSSTPIQLTAEQSMAIDKLATFLADPNPKDNFFVLSGFAGTGKTFCMREVVARMGGSKAKFAFTAPTNKAAKVLKRVVGEATTIYSLLGLRIDKSGELKKLVGSTPPDLSDIEAIFLDEGGMVNSNLFTILRAQDVKVVFMGDPAQLPPVGEPASPIWAKCGIGASLSTVMRHDNQILSLCTRIRDTMNSIAPSIAITSDNDGNEGVWKQSKRDFKQSIYDAVCRGDFADGSKSKVIAWRNVRVQEYNDLIRNALWGAESQHSKYMVGERIVAAEPCMRGEDVLMTTDEEAIVESVVPCKHPMEPKYQALELKCRTEYNRTVRLLVLHPDSQADFDRDSQNLAHQAKGDGKLWKKFWEHKALFHDIRYAYALTAHRSQGSTYENVWVDYQDILVNRNRKEAFQCLYVACSRPTTRLYLA